MTTQGLKIVPSTHRNPISSRNSARSEPAIPPSPAIQQPEVKSALDQPINPIELESDQIPICRTAVRDINLLSSPSYRIQIRGIASNPTPRSITEPRSINTDSLEEKRRKLEYLKEFLAI